MPVVSFLAILSIPLFHSPVSTISLSHQPPKHIPSTQVNKTTTLDRNSSKISIFSHSIRKALLCQWPVQLAQLVVACCPYGMIFSSPGLALLLRRWTQWSISHKSNAVRTRQRSINHCVYLMGQNTRRECGRYLSIGTNDAEDELFGARSRLPTELRSALDWRRTP